MLLLLSLRQTFRVIQTENRKILVNILCNIGIKKTLHILDHMMLNSFYFQTKHMFISVVPNQLATWHSIYVPTLDKRKLFAPYFRFRHLRYALLFMYTKNGLFVKVLLVLALKYKSQESKMELFCAECSSCELVIINTALRC